MFVLVTNLFFFVLLTANLSITLATDQLNEQILDLLVYYILLHVSSTVVFIIRRSNFIIQHLANSHSVGDRPVHTWAPDDKLQSVTIPDAA